MIIPQHIIDELIDQAKKDAPNESCGYLLGLPSSGEEGQGVVAKESVVTENYWMENIDHSSEHFSFAPKEPSRPSQEDLRLANDPTIRYAILSLLDGEPKLNSFKILNGEVVDKEVHL